MSNHEIEDLERAAKQLQEQMFSIDEDISKIKTQLEAAKTRRWSEGVSSDPQWWVKANTALRIKGQQRQRMQAGLGELNKQIRKLRNEGECKIKEESFIVAARKMLPMEQFREIWAEAERIRASF